MIHSRSSTPSFKKPGRACVDTECFERSERSNPTDVAPARARAGPPPRGGQASAGRTTTTPLMSSRTYSGGAGASAARAAGAPARASAAAGEPSSEPRAGPRSVATAAVTPRSNTVVAEPTRPRPGAVDRPGSSLVTQHGDPPDQGPPRREERPRRPAGGPSILPQGQPRQGHEVADAAPRVPCAHRVGRQLLLQAELPRHPVDHRVIDVQGHGQPGEQAGRVIAPDDVRQLVRQHRAALGFVPRPPVLRQQDHRPPPARRGRADQVGDLAQLDRRATSDRPAQLVEQAEHPRVVERASRDVGRRRPPRGRAPAGAGPRRSRRAARAAARRPHGRHRAAGSAAPRSSRAQATRQPANGHPSPDGRIGASRAGRDGAPAGVAASADAASSAPRTRRPRPAPDAGQERRGVQHHDEPQAQRRDPRPRGGAPSRGQGIQGQRRREHERDLDGQPRQRHSEVVHRPCSFRICSRTARSSADSLR